MRAHKKAFVWGRLGEHAFAIAEDEKQPKYKREKALEMAFRFYKRAHELLDSEECLWAWSSTNEKGEFEMPRKCQRKGCKGLFKKEEEKPYCFINVEDLTKDDAEVF